MANALLQPENRTNGGAQKMSVYVLRARGTQVLRFNQLGVSIISAACDREVAIAEPSMRGEDALFVFGHAKIEIGLQMVPSQPAIGGDSFYKAVGTPRNVLRGDCDRPRETLHINSCRRAFRLSGRS